MSLTRKFLKALGLEEDKIEEIITAHSDTVTALKEQIEQYKADAEKLPAVQAELDKAKEGNGDSYKAKYDTLKEAHEKYIAEIASKETQSKKQAAYKALLAECKISDKRHDAILKLADLASVELDEKGNIKDAEKIKAALTTEWAEFVETTTTKTPAVPTPPATTTNPLDVLQQKYDAAMKAKNIPEAMAVLQKIKTETNKE